MRQRRCSSPTLDMKCTYAPVWLTSRALRLAGGLCLLISAVQAGYIKPSSCLQIFEKREDTTQQQLGLPPPKTVFYALMAKGQAALAAVRHQPAACHGICSEITADPAVPDYATQRRLASICPASRVSS